MDFIEDRQMKILLLTALLTSITACTTVPQKQASCNLHNTNLTDLFTQAESNLQYTYCQYAFDDYQQQLMSKAKGEPGMANRKLFTHFYETAVNQSVISKLDAKKTLTRYFSPRFSDLLTKHQANCGLSKEQDKFFSSMQIAMQNKREGLIEILGDTQSYNQAAALYDDFIFVLAVTFDTCRS